MRTAAALLLLGLCSAHYAVDDLGNSTIVTTTYGQLQGVEDTNVAGVTVFKGIPFAASTAGEARWTAPQPPASWDGVKVADTFGLVCPQSGVSSDTMSEDCLNLNVWTSADTVDDALLIYVWIYGGRFIGGAGSLPLYDGAGLAAKGARSGHAQLPDGSSGLPRHARATARVAQQLHRQLRSAGPDPGA